MNPMRTVLAAVFPILAGLAVPVLAQPAPTAQEMEDWFNAKSISEVNEGELVWLAAAPAKPVHHHQNIFHIDEASLTTGWVRLEQCHDHLDAVPRAQITFREGFVRGLKVTESRGVEEAWPKGASLQLRGVTPGARLCLEAETRAMSNAGNGYYNLNNGPYMRKFLDGYYPMRVSIQLNFPPDRLRVIAISPDEQTGFQVTQQEGQVQMEALFEGQLRTHVQFEQP